MSKVRVLIVDDSVVFRSQIKTAFEKVDWIEVIGVASNGKIALEKMRLQNPDLVTLDLEMPELNGIETLQQMRDQSLRSKVIVFTSASQSGAQKTLEALNLGALDFISKPNQDNSKSIYELLVPSVTALFKESREIKLESQAPREQQQVKENFNWQSFSPQAIVIGSSTGGPTALEKIFSMLKAPFSCPIFIAQHMPPIFTASMAARIQKICGVQCDEARDGELVQNNRIYVAPGNFHMQVVRQSGALKMSLNQQPLENSVRPAVDQLFRSAAEVYNNNVLGIILTGMGKDGLLGSIELRKKKAPVIIQERESCIVFGMPGALFEANQYDSIQNLESISATLKSYLSDQNSHLRKAL